MAKEAGGLEREHTQVNRSVLDLTQDLSAALREREQLKTRTLTAAQLREKAREEWLELRSAGGKNPDKVKGIDKSRENGLDPADEPGKGKGKNRARDDDDFSL